MAYFAKTDKEAFEATKRRIKKCVTEVLRPRLDCSNNEDLDTLIEDLLSKNKQIEEYIRRIP